MTPIAAEALQQLVRAERAVRDARTEVKRLISDKQLPSTSCILLVSVDNVQYVVKLWGEYSSPDVMGSVE